MDSDKAYTSTGSASAPGSRSDRLPLRPSSRRHRPAGAARKCLVGAAPLTAGFLGACLAGPVFAQSLDERARAVADLRVEVDDLAERVRAERSRLARARERIERETLDLELAIVRAEARRTAARRRLAEALEATSRREAQAQAQVPVLLDAAAMLEAHVRDGIPFRSDERLATLDEIRRGLERETLPADRAAAQLWRHVREELRLAESSGLGRQVVPVAGEAVLADVARLGLVALLFRLPDGRVGYTQPLRGRGHRFRLTREPDEVGAIAQTFDALGRGRAPGRLMLPVRCLVEAGE